MLNRISLIEMQKWRTSVSLDPRHVSMGLKKFHLKEMGLTLQHFGKRPASAEKDDTL